ncbi:hypothetical protein GDO81_019849 [Engystomops pustulosus]|uniref:Uncharacterized protein n=1 Tax=Engystomops pustulosus TaxID=76066 RepID=A0AAV6ZIK3_ENGPU|nr:hypothetical protein GDO81_019849 [Engystomops pustulosus]
MKWFIIGYLDPCLPCGYSTLIQYVHSTVGRGSCCMRTTEDRTPRYLSFLKSTVLLFYYSGLTREMVHNKLSGPLLAKWFILYPYNRFRAQWGEAPVA